MRNSGNSSRPAETRAPKRKVAIALAISPVSDRLHTIIDDTNLALGFNFSQNPLKSTNRGPILTLNIFPFGTEAVDGWGIRNVQSCRSAAIYIQGTSGYTSGSVMFRYDPCQIHKVRSKVRYWMASLTCSGRMPGLSSKSAMVRGDLQDPVVGARAQIQLGHRHANQFLGIVSQLAIRP